MGDTVPDFQGASATAPQVAAARRLGFSTKLLYGVGSVAFGVKDTGFAFFLLLYYNQVLGLPERMGRLRHHAGARLPTRSSTRSSATSRTTCTAAGAAGIRSCTPRRCRWRWRTTACGIRPSGLSPHGLFGYFLGVSVIVRILIACYEIPSSSLVPELTDHYDERTSILSFRFFFGWCGGLAWPVGVRGVSAARRGAPGRACSIPTGIDRYGLVSAVVMAVAILASALGTHSLHPAAAANRPCAWTARSACDGR